MGHEAVYHETLKNKTKHFPLLFPTIAKYNSHKTSF